MVLSSFLGRGTFRGLSSACSLFTSMLHGFAVALSLIARAPFCMSSSCSSLFDKPDYPRVKGVTTSKRVR